MSDPKIITEPRVYVLARPLIDMSGLQPFLDEVGAPEWSTDTLKDAEAVVEIAGRLCYDSFANPRPGGNAAYIGHILEAGHGSVLEHAVWTLLITGVSRSLSHELIRHRHLSPSQLSQRFVDESDCAFVLPGIMSHCGVAEYAAWEDHCRRSLQLYGELVDHFMELIDDTDDRTLRRKRAREAARSVLPNCVETRLCLTGNARAWIGLLAQRGTRHADAEFRRLAIEVARVLAAEAPNIFGHISVAREDGIDVLQTPYRKP